MVTPTPEQIARLIARVTSNIYQCPICLHENRDHYGATVGTLILDWDEDIDNGGYVLSRWPVFSGTCVDPPRDDAYRHAMRGYRTLPLNHADQLNQAIEDDGIDEHVARLLGQSYERRAAAEILGIVARR